MTEEVPRLVGDDEDCPHCGGTGNVVAEYRETALPDMRSASECAAFRDGFARKEAISIANRCYIAASRGEKVMLIDTVASDVQKYLCQKGYEVVDMNAKGKQSVHWLPRVSDK